MIDAMHCLCECMGMQAENMQRSYRGESMAYTEEAFEEVRKKWTGVDK